VPVAAVAALTAAVDPSLVRHVRHVGLCRSLGVPSSCQADRARRRRVPLWSDLVVSVRPPGCARVPSMRSSASLADVGRTGSSQSDLRLSWLRSADIAAELLCCTALRPRLVHVGASDAAVQGIADAPSYKLVSGDLLGDGLGDHDRLTTVGVLCSCGAERHTGELGNTDPDCLFRGCRENSGVTSPQLGQIWPAMFSIPPRMTAVPRSSSCSSR
jgi:hypothetical protein